MGICIELQNQIIEIGNKHPSKAAPKYLVRLMKVGIPAQIKTGRVEQIVLTSPCSQW